MIEKILLFAICLIMMTALGWIMPVGAAIVVSLFTVLEGIKNVKPKTKRKPIAPKPKGHEFLKYDGGYYRR